MTSSLLRFLVSSSAAMHGLLGVVTLAAGGTLWWGSQQLSAAHCAAQERRTAAHALLARAEELRAEWKSLQAAQEAADQELKTLQAKLPPSADESTFLQQISDLATQHRVVLSEFRPGNLLRCDDHQEIELRLRCSGEYASLCRWLDGIGQLPRMSRMSQLTVSAPRLAGEGCLLDCQINLLFGLMEDKKASETVTP